MAEQQRNARPAARVLFIVPSGGRPKGDQDGGGYEDKFVELAAAWRTAKGSLRFTLDMVPARLLAGESTTFVVVFEEPEDGTQPSSSSSSKAPAPRGRR
jgi:hypothetical protein